MYSKNTTHCRLQIKCNGYKSGTEIVTHKITTRQELLPMKFTLQEKDPGIIKTGNTKLFFVPLVLLMVTLLASPASAVV